MQVSGLVVGDRPSAAIPTGKPEAAHQTPGSTRAWAYRHSTGSTTPAHTLSLRRLRYWPLNPHRRRTVSSEYHAPSLHASMSGSWVDAGAGRRRWMISLRFSTRAWGPSTC